MRRVTCTSEYSDVELGRRMRPGDTWEVSDERAEQLKRAGVVEFGAVAAPARDRGAEAGGAGCAAAAEDGDAAGTGASSDELDALNMNQLREVAKPLGVSIKPGMSKEAARAAIREARAAQQ